MARKSILRACAATLALAGGLHTLCALAQVEVTGAWARATVPGQTASGAYMTIKAAADAKLVAVSSPGSKVAEVHEMKMDGGVMTMRAIEQLDLPAGKPVALTPNGHHVMLMGLAKPLKEGETLPLTLVVEDASGKRHDMRVSATVRGLTAPK